MFVTSVYKPDISMTLNGVLAGVGVTAGCAAVSPVEQLHWTYLWCCSGLAIEFIDKKLKWTIQ
jgi:ammonia channel protein AmtB